MSTLSPLARALLALAVGALFVILIDRFVLPGTLVPGLIGVAAAVAVTTLMRAKKA